MRHVARRVHRSHVWHVPGIASSVPREVPAENLNAHEFLLPGTADRVQLLDRCTVFFDRVRAGMTVR